MLYAEYRQQDGRDEHGEKVTKHQGGETFRMQAREIDAQRQFRQNRNVGDAYRYLLPEVHDPLTLSFITGKRPPRPALNPKHSTRVERVRREDGLPSVVIYLL
jgi:hypothetical protein